MKILLGGSPCTNWSIAQKNNRETEPDGIGWELFKNYLIAKEKFKPDYFLYENNKSAAKPIKDQISRELGVPLQYINSALVSAQNRQRFYAHNIPNVPQPEDRGTLLRDVLDSGVPCRNEKSYCLDANYYKGGNLSNFNKQSGQRMMVAEPINTTVDGKAQTIRATCYKDGIRNLVGNDVDKRTAVAEPVRVGTMPQLNGMLKDNQATRIYSIDGKSVTQSAQGGGWGAKTGLYAEPVREELTPFVVKKLQNIVDKYGYLPKCFNPYNSAKITDKSPTMTTGCGSQTTSATVFNILNADGKTYPIYEVRNGLITIKGKQYPIKLPDGYYIIRKLTVSECRRLQTIPDWYIMPCSKTQCYKMLGNGWTVEVIKHILSHIPNIQNEEILVLSMYDGMSCGQIALRELGCNVVKYYSTEIDKYAIQTTMANFPDTIQLGDAFQVREPEWEK